MCEQKWEIFVPRFEKEKNSIFANLKILINKLDETNTTVQLRALEPHKLSHSMY